MVLSLPSVESQVCHVYGAVTVAVKAAGSSLCVSRMLSMQKVQVSIINKGLIIKKRNVKCMVKRDQYDIQAEERPGRLRKNIGRKQLQPRPAQQQRRRQEINDNS